MWKQELIYARRAQTSNVFLIETEDPKRIEEILTWVTSQKFNTEIRDNLRIKLQLDPWEGLQQLNTVEKDGSITKTPYKGEDPFASTGGTMGWSLGDLKTCDAELKRGACVLIITGVNEPDAAKTLQRAVQNWIHHPQIRREGPEKSTVIILTSNFQFFDDYTRKHAVLIRPPPSTYEERKTLVESVAEATSKALGAPKNSICNNTTQLAATSAGMNLHTLETALHKSIFRHKTLKLEEITATKMALMRQQGYELVYPKYGFEAVGGYTILKNYIKTHITGIISSNKAREWGIKPSRGILFFGLGGTGKTIFAKAIAKEMNLPFIKVSSSDLFRGIVGGSESQVIQLQKIAEENAPCIVFFDEIDQLALRRDMIMSTDSGASRRVQNLLMDWLGTEERGSIVVGATNLISQLDPAFIRQGRWGQVIPTLPPDEEARREIFHVHLSVVRHIPLEDVDLNRLARETFLWTGAEIEALCVEAATLALVQNADRVTMKHFEQAFQEITVNLEKRQNELQQFIREAQTYSTSKRLLETQLKDFVKKEGQASRLEALLKELE